jgi:hypothetical protein
LCAERRRVLDAAVDVRLGREVGRACRSLLADERRHAGASVMSAFSKRNAASDLRSARFA